jgi:hypothetical protein
MTEIQSASGGQTFGSLNIGIWNLFVIWVLLFGALELGALELGAWNFINSRIQYYLAI